jgi:pimeloyl-ACP methyl ester carboxylesterase
MTTIVNKVWPEGYVEANGIRMHYWRTGDGRKAPVSPEGGKPALVLCHGFSDNGLCWRPIAQMLEDDFDIVMVDARGHGLSDAPETGYTTADRADDVAGVVKALGLAKPAILGHSMGASTAAAAAAQYPDLFGKVLLEDPAWFAEGSRRQATTDEERAAWNKERHDRIIEQKQMTKEALIAMCRQNSPTWQEAELDAWAESKQQLSPHVVGGTESKPRPWQEIAAAITVPTLLITASNEKGGIVTPEIAAAAKALNPKIEVVLINDAGHNIRREATAAYIKMVKRFLDV